MKKPTPLQLIKVNSQNYNAFDVLFDVVSDFKYNENYLDDSPKHIEFQQKLEDIETFCLEQMGKISTDSSQLLKQVKL